MGATIGDYHFAVYADLEGDYDFTLIEFPEIEIELPKG